MFYCPVIAAGCILLLTLQHQPDDSNEFTLISLIKEAFGKEKVRFVEQQQQQLQQQQEQDARPKQPQPEGSQQQQQASGDGAAAAAGRDGSSKHAFMVRFRQAADAKTALDSATAAGPEFKVAGFDATVQLVEGQQEEEYYKRVSLGVPADWSYCFSLQHQHACIDCECLVQQRGAPRCCPVLGFYSALVGISQRRTSTSPTTALLDVTLLF